MREEFKKDIIAMSKEFDEHEGFITCEVSIHIDKLPQMVEFVKDMLSLTHGKWVAIECDTCVGYHGEGYIHVSIERNETILKIEKATNYIKTI